ncbi:hypothetical protein CLF_100178 [Clonorchis sinensis]|uniref:Uncharacterized protein n=1 Tax=Clonorchis sinensis TaxID=79923 RepID=G7Y2V1_CLOSI|nr:hypothetical protein CLF_100178 [Clonorchis sinensis]
MVLIVPVNGAAQRRLLTGIQSRLAHLAMELNTTPISQIPRATASGSPDARRVDSEQSGQECAGRLRGTPYRSHPPVTINNTAVHSIIRFRCFSSGWFPLNFLAWLNFIQGDLQDYCSTKARQQRQAALSLRQPPAEWIRICASLVLQSELSETN